MLEAWSVRTLLWLGQDVVLGNRGWGGGEVVWMEPISIAIGFGGLALRLPASLVIGTLKPTTFLKPL
jgi:hypothetical protein